MLNLERIGLFTRDEEPDVPLGGLKKLFQRANIELVLDAAQAAPGSLDLIIALGGDGTVLRALTSHPGTPVLAVNFGTVGFLTQSDREDLDKVLVRLLSDDYRIEERLTLSVRRGDEQWQCINEAVIKGVTRMVTVAIKINGHLVHTPRGDGVIVGTPTGTTAYLLSTGAPIVTPDVDCIIVKPLNEYSFSSRSIILPGNVEVELTVMADRESDIRLIVDGHTRVALEAGDVLRVTRSDLPARLVYFDADYFFRNLKRRLRW